MPPGRGESAPEKGKQFARSTPKKSNHILKRRIHAKKWIDRAREAPAFIQLEWDSVIQIVFVFVKSVILRFCFGFASDEFDAFGDDIG